MKRRPAKSDRGDVFADYHRNSDTMSVAFFPDRSGMRFQLTHNWCDGKHRPLTRAWRTKALRQLGFDVVRWNRTDWGEQAEFAK